MSEPQKDLFEKPRHSADADILWLENLLKQSGEWEASGQILFQIQRPPTDGNKRWLREVASQSAWIISGQKGYKHIEHSTAEEINHAAAWLESQAKKMGERAGAIRSNAHKIFG
jgi:hypothetical protein